MAKSKEPVANEIPLVKQWKNVTSAPKIRSTKITSLSLASNDGIKEKHVVTQMFEMHNGAPQIMLHVVTSVDWWIPN